MEMIKTIRNQGPPFCSILSPVAVFFLRSSFFCCIYHHGFFFCISSEILCVGIESMRSDPIFVLFTYVHYSWKEIQTKE